MAKQIRTFGMSNMTVGACVTFHTTTLKYITTTTPEILHIENKIEAYREKAKQLELLVNRKRAYRTTPEMREIDYVRDRASGTIQGALNSFCTSPVEEKRLLALRLSQDLAAYRGIRDHEYSKQTAEVTGMLRILDLEENKTAIARFGLTEEVEALRQANADFAEKFDERVLEVSAAKDASDIESKELMREVNAMYQDIAQVINAYAIVQPSDEIDEFITKMNGLVGAMADVAGTGSGTSSTEGETPENPDTENPDGGEGSGTEEPDEDDEQQGIPHP